jgi:hypothetical protein
VKKSATVAEVHECEECVEWTVGHTAVLISVLSVIGLIAVIVWLGAISWPSSPPPSYTNIYHNDYSYATVPGPKAPPSYAFDFDGNHYTCTPDTVVSGGTTTTPDYSTGN